MFYANSFLLDSVPSEKYNLKIYTPNGGESMVQGSSEMDIIAESPLRRPRQYLLGAQIVPGLEFELDFVSPYELDAAEQGAIERWLFGVKKWRRLAIVQPDLQNVYLECIFTSHKTFRVGNIVRGFSATVHLSSPWGYTYPKTKTYVIATTGRNVTFVNTSDDENYLYPIIQLSTATLYGGTVTISNSSDNNRAFSFTGLSGGETLTVDNDLKTITSSTKLLRLENFNKNWFRLVSGLNALSVVGEITSFSITYQFAKKIL